MKPKEILEKYYHDNLANGVLIYDAYSVNLIQAALQWMEWLHKTERYYKIWHVQEILFSWWQWRVIR